jgi:hypothetical protein
MEPPCTVSLAPSDSEHMIIHSDSKWHSNKL